MPFVVAPIPMARTGGSVHGQFQATKMFLFDFYFDIYSCADRLQTLTAWMALMLEYYDDPCRLIDHMAMMDRHMHRHVKVHSESGFHV